MHDDEVRVTVDDARRLVATQVPWLAHLPVTPLADGGTDHRLFLLGDPADPPYLVRLPKIEWASAQAVSDARWLPALGPRLPLAVPAPVALGEPDDAYPFRWSVVPWLPGRSPGDPLGGEPLGARGVARDLGRFVRALRDVDPAGGPVKEGTSRGVPIARLDAIVRENLAAVAAGEPSGDAPVDVPAAAALWERVLAAPASSEAVWIHGDLLPGNLLVHDGRLSAVIDWGGLGVGDAAVDLGPAWWLFAGEERKEFLAEATAGLSPADAAAAVERARGWVLVQAVTGIPYYRTRWPAFSLACRRRLRAVLSP
ncbi:aminoglycoside phosphotransferase family protein [Xylanimonas protaetiae]|uniref:Aminoglycoside phosphotransferase family protein n=1 Tax=Xylanimonas protaetiae TaxID=2509457 RepID=A0A4V0YGM7_9MICO|nr:aminoglycoside phosphotransferase family protein [Xylanimonas protaetiae]QAY71751.1 aminoglycoside phosphotransferase family protein [Xylanimonas protaetiae]